MILLTYYFSFSRTTFPTGAYDWQGGSVSGAVYHVSQEISKVACEAYTLTAYTNPLHADVFPGINKMEAEVVRMAVNLFHGDDDCCGTVRFTFLILRF